MHTITETRMDIYIDKKNAEIATYITILIYAVVSTYYTHNSIVFIGFTFATGIIRILSNDFSKKELRSSSYLIILGVVLGLLLF